MSAKNRKVLHLLPNAHLDPVWLWDWREGLSEGLITVRTMLDLMDEYPQLTFVRGESSIYEHVERREPDTFRRLKKRIAEGRWDVVGGNYVQPDTNLPDTETMARQFQLGQRYFRQAFKRPAKIAWAADSFGHSAGLPEILAAAGFEGFSFSRPGQNQVPLAKPAFWWRAASGAQVLAYRVPTGWYGSERDEVTRKLDATLKYTETCAMRNFGVYMGLGDHGGGPTRRQIADALAWAEAHPEIEVRFSTLTKFFAALRAEAAGQPADYYPTHEGELNFCLRGCYASVARFKYAFRRAEALVNRGETIAAAVAGKLNQPAPDLTEAWAALAFNSFHDILPGSSIERAYDDQLAWLGGAVHQAQRAELNALTDLAEAVDTTVRKPEAADRPVGAALLVFNPHPRPYRGPVEVEASLDYRPIWAYRNKAEELPTELIGPDGKPVAHQVIMTEHSSMPELAWRKRVVFSAELPPLGWAVYELAWREKAKQPKVGAPARALKAGVIDNGIYRVEARKGAGGLKILHQGKPVLGSAGLNFATMADIYGSWGGMREEPDSFIVNKVLHRWKVVDLATLENGPERAKLWVRLAGGDSRLDLEISLSRQRAAVDVFARVMWNERSARLKMILPGLGQKAEFAVPGGTAVRGEVGDVPGINWVRVRDGKKALGFASDALYSFDLYRGALQATLLRSTRFANDVPTPPDREIWRPATDQGEHRLRFILTPGGAELTAETDLLERPPLSLVAPKTPGKLPRAGAIGELTHPLRLLALKNAAGRAKAGELVLRAQNSGAKPEKAKLNWLGGKLDLGVVKPGEIVTWRLSRAGGRWTAKRTDITES